MIAGKMGRHTGCVAATFMSTKSHRRSERRKHLNESNELSEADRRIAGEIMAALLGAISFGTLSE